MGGCMNEVNEVDVTEGLRPRRLWLWLIQSLSGTGRMTDLEGTCRIDCCCPVDEVRGGMTLGELKEVGLGEGVESMVAGSFCARLERNMWATGRWGLMRGEGQSYS